MIRNIVRSAITFVASKSQVIRIEKIIKDGLPPQMGPALLYLATGRIEEDAALVASHVEERREQLSSQGEKEVPILYSPKPGSAGKQSDVNTRPAPGRTLNFTLRQIAETGKNRKWGIVLYLIARDFKARVVFELGSCAGISAMYLSSAKNVQKLITVEGSQVLSEIANESLKSHPCAIVVNSLFDEAIDSYQNLLRDKVDLAYIDGHHEKTATIHYFNRILPLLNEGAVVIFDDISWSQDMRDAWETLTKRAEFSHAIDLGAIGVCVLDIEAKNRQSKVRYWDLQRVFGRWKIGSPHGWQE